MTNIEQILTDVRRYLLSTVCHCDLTKPCGRCRTVAAFTADMPGAIGWFVMVGDRHLFGCDTEEGESCTCGYEDALAKLEGKPSTIPIDEPYMEVKGPPKIINKPIDLSKDWDARGESK